MYSQIISLCNISCIFNTSCWSIKCSFLSLRIHKIPLLALLPPPVCIRPWTLMICVWCAQVHLRLACLHTRLHLRSRSCCFCTWQFVFTLRLVLFRYKSKVFIDLQRKQTLHVATPLTPVLVSTVLQWCVDLIMWARVLHNKSPVAWSSTLPKDQTSPRG